VEISFGTGEFVIATGLDVELEGGRRLGEFAIATRPAAEVEGVEWLEVFATTTVGTSGCGTLGPEVADVSAAGTTTVGGEGVSHIRVGVGADSWHEGMADVVMVISGGRLEDLRRGVNLWFADVRSAAVSATVIGKEGRLITSSLFGIPIVARCGSL
jgi:hypothetical protein